MTAAKQKSATRAQLLARESKLTGKAQQIAAEINAAAQRKVEAQKRRKAMKLVPPGPNGCCGVCWSRGGYISAKDCRHENEAQP